MNRLEAFSLDLLSLIESGAVSSRKGLNEAKIRLCAMHGLSSMPSNATILSFARERTGKIVSLLRVKPTRSLSGIAVVAIMPKPSKCPGKCIYCPSSLVKGKETPKSYTGKEPATMRALSAGFSPRTQILNRVRQLEEAGHSTGKLELIVMGGTFLAHPKPRQRKFIIASINALSGASAKTLGGARLAAENAERKITGITFETRPDFCGRREINAMLEFGGTRCELGVQTVYDNVYKAINRGHSVSDVVDATVLLKDSAFKVTYHYMPGLPGVALGQDRKALRRLFSDHDFMPDNLKVYPCLVIEGTRLHKMWKARKYRPFTTEKAVRLLSSAKEEIPKWARVMRIQRDIPAQLISAGVKKSNLRQLVQREMQSHGKSCSCIRCREAGLLSRDKENRLSQGGLFTESYEASKGIEHFISFESNDQKCLFGFCRLRLPCKPFRKELLGKTALVRELRVFGVPLPLHERNKDAIQHRGLGKTLLSEAEEIARNELDARKLAVISGLGVKPYYYSLGFKKDGLFVSKML